MELLLSFMTLSAIGTLLWLILFSIRPITQKFFSQTWHYYANLIPLFFMLGGSFLIDPIVRAMYTVLHSGNVNTIGEKVTPVTVVEQATENTAFLNIIVNDVSGKLNFNTIAPYVAMLWVIGLLVYFVLKLKAYYQFKSQILDFSVIFEIKKSPIKVIKSPIATTPMLLGIRHPVIVLPDFELSDKELDIILSHELIHQKRGDLIIKLFVLITNGVHWFNPFVYQLNKDMDALCERSCDEKLVCDLDKEERKFYGETIISMLEYGVSQKNGLYTSFCDSKKNIKRRLLNMMNFKKTKMSLTALSLVVAIVITGFGGTMAFAMSSVINDTKSSWYEKYKPMMAAEQIYVNGELIDGFPAFYTQSAKAGGVFEENIYIPLKAVSEKLGLKVTWDSKTGTATVGGVQVKQNVNPSGYSGSTPQIFSGYLYISPNFFTTVLNKDLKLTYKGIVRHETIQLGSQVYDIDLEENLQTGTKWKYSIDEKSGIGLLKDEYLGSDAGATDEKAIHRFTFKLPRTYAPTTADEAIFTFEEMLGGKKTGNKIVYTAIQSTMESVPTP